jgi:hypothetical protein
VQLFGTYRVVGFDAWARAKEGRIERVFAISDVEVTANEGAQTSEEAELGFLDLGRRGPREATEYLYQRANEIRAQQGEGRRQKELDAYGRPCRFHDDPVPSEDHTVAIAGMWSMDPTILDRKPWASGVGYVGRLPRI